MAPHPRNSSPIHLSRPLLVVAVAASLPLGITACSKDSEDAAPAATSTTTSSSSSAASFTSRPPSSVPASSAPETPTDPAELPSFGDISPQPGSPEVNGVSSDSGLQAIDAPPANEQDQKAITDLVMGLNNVATARDMALYFPRNSCSALVEANGGQQALEEQAGLADDRPVAEIPGFTENPPVRSVDDVRVNGDDASATVVSWDATAGQETSAVMHFHRENGKWTFCG